MPEHSDRYDLHERIGRGGMAEVWRGTRRLAQGSLQTVAIKRLYGFLGGELPAVVQLEREARICMALRHEHLVSVYDMDRVDGQPCLVMEYVDGITLRDLMNSGAVPPPMVRAILQDVLAGLEHAHKHGVLHRDISPRNIMITRDGIAKVMDFGVAKNLRTAHENSGFKGTLPYASREALECEPLARGSDIYSVGAVFYEALTRVQPYGTGDRLDMVRRMAESPRPPLPDGTPDDLCAFLDFALGPTATRTDAAVDQAIADLRASLGPVMPRDELAASIRAILDKDTPAKEPAAVPPEHADTVDLLKHTETAKFKPEEWAALLAESAEAAARDGAEDSRESSAVRTASASRARSWLGRLAVAAVVLLAALPLLDRALDHHAHESTTQPAPTNEPDTPTEHLTGPRRVAPDHVHHTEPAPGPNDRARPDPTDEHHAKRHADSSQPRKVTRLRDAFPW